MVALDFETANRYRNSPCAIGIVVADSTGIIDEFYSLINPLMEFENMNTYVHGITESDVQDAPTFPELWPTIHDYISESLVVAHNASFDMSVIRSTLDRFDLGYPNLDYFCSIPIAKAAWPGLPNYKLNTLADFKGITFEHHHALEDARVLSKLLIKAMEETKTTHLKALGEGFNISCGKIFERSYKTPKVKRNSSKRKVY